MNYQKGRFSQLSRSLVRQVRAGGVASLLGLCLRWITLPVWRRLVRRDFQFRGEDYHYVLANYNVTWSNERAIELAIVERIVRAHAGQRILEVGNVLSHYCSVTHDVVDKFERRPGVINSDILEFNAPRCYDLIVSISTLEHVGWDDDPKEPARVLIAIDRLRRFLCPAGSMVFTVPVGYNPFIDELLTTGQLSLTDAAYMTRNGLDNFSWREEAMPALGSLPPYGGRLPGANGVVIGVLGEAVWPARERGER